MTSHEKALEAASEKAYQLFDGFEPLMNEVDSIVKTYLTTLLDSPEMVEALCRGMCIGRNPDAVVPNPRPSGQIVGLEGHTALWQRYQPLAKAVIAAIKKEIGLS